jgi:hypothetical protein
LAALETNFVVTTGTRLLAFMTTTRCFTNARTDTTANTSFVMLCAVSRLDAIEFHEIPLKAL